MEKGLEIVNCRRHDRQPSDQIKAYWEGMKNAKNGGRGASKGIIEASRHASSLYCLGVK